MIAIIPSLSPESRWSFWLDRQRTRAKPCLFVNTDGSPYKTFDINILDDTDVDSSIRSRNLMNVLHTPGLHCEWKVSNNRPLPSGYGFTSVTASLSHSNLNVYRMMTGHKHTLYIQATAQPKEDPLWLKHTTMRSLKRSKIILWYPKMSHLDFRSHFLRLFYNTCHFFRQSWRRQ